MAVTVARFGSLQDMTAISIDTAAVVTDTSTRTLRRRMANGSLTKLPSDTAGRTMLPLEQIQDQIVVALAPGDVDFLLKADEGDPVAQDDMGNLFLELGKASIGIYWLNLAAQKGHANAMQRLGQCYASGEGVDKDENLALMWIAKAASLGHVIASHQMSILRNGS